MWVSFGVHVCSGVCCFVCGCLLVYMCVVVSVALYVGVFWCAQYSAYSLDSYNFFITVMVFLCSCYCHFVESASGLVPLASALQVFCTGHLPLSSWPLRLALGAQGVVFWRSHFVARAYSSLCSLMILSMDA